MPSVSTIESLLAVLRQAQALKPGHMQDLEKIAPRFKEPRALAQYLLKQNWLTAFQANQLIRGGELVLGPYLLLERLGEGHSGQVYKARHLRMNRIVALKVIRKELVSDPQAVERFYQEVEAASRLTHPHLTHAYDAGPMGPTHCLAGEFVDGVDLARLVQADGPLSVAKACRAIHQAALGLQFAHEHGMVHGAVKPSKLVLTQTSDAEGHTQSVVKLLDMGLASLHRSSNGQALHGALCNVGTADFMAPEQLNDGKPVDIRTDVFSLGCTFHYILTGQIPFTGPTRTPAASAADVRPEVPAPVAQLIARMIAVDPAHRPATPGEVAVALTPFAGPDASEVFGRLREVEPTPLRPRQSTWLRWLVMGLASLTLLAALVGIFTWATKPAPPTISTEPVVVLHWLDGKRIAPEERAKAPQLLELANVLRHGKQPIRSLAFSAKDNRVISGGEDGLVKVWDWGNGREVATLQGHGRPVVAVACGSVIASGGRDKKVRIWDAASLTEKQVLGVETEWVNTLCFSPDHKYLVGRYRNHELRVWQLPDCQPLFNLSNNGKRIRAADIAVDGKTLAMGSDEKLVRIVDLDAGNKTLQQLKGHDREVVAVAFTPDGQTLLSGSEDQVVKIWDTKTWQERASFTRHSTGVKLLATDGKVVVSAGGDTAILWQLANQSVIKEWRLPAAVSGLALAPDGHVLIACENGAIYIMKLPSAA